MHISSSYAKILEGGNYFAHGRFPEVGQKQKTEKKRRERKRERKTERGNNNGQATHGARKHAWRTQAAWAKSKMLMYSNLQIQNIW